MNDHAPTPEFRRARSPEAKAERRRAIMQAAAELVDENGPEAVTLAAIAERAGVVKSGVYKYFESREEILIRLLSAELNELADETERALAPLQGSDDAEAVAAIFARGAAGRPRVCRLAGVLANVLERNVTGETLLSCKRELTEAGGRFVAAGLAACPSVGPENWMLAARLFFSLLGGHWALAHPAPHVAELMERPEFAPMRKDFEGDLSKGTAAMLRGLMV